MLLLLCTNNCFFDFMQNPTLKKILKDNQCDSANTMIKKELGNLILAYNEFTELFFKASAEVIQADKKDDDELEGYIFNIVDQIFKNIDDISEFIEDNDWNGKKIKKMVSCDFLFTVTETIEVYETILKKELTKLREFSKKISIIKYNLDYKSEADKVAILSTFKYLKKEMEEKEWSLLLKITDSKDEL